MRDAVSGTSSAPEDEWGGNPPPFSAKNLLVVGVLIVVAMGIFGGVAVWTGEVERVAAEERERLAQQATRPGSEPCWSVALDAEPLDGGLLRNRRDGAVLVAVPAGAFAMGRDDGPRRCRPSREVTLTAFHIDRDPVTRARYAVFLAWVETAGSGHAHRHPGQPRSKTSHVPDGWDPAAADGRPVTGVDWFDAYAYASWAGLRLPTEAEWERAARGTDGRRYPWGSAAPTAALAQFGDLGADATPAAVGSLSGASPAGVRQLVGSVWEWCYDRYAADYYGRGAASDPLGPATGSQRVIRGGSFRSAASELHAADRRWREATARASDVGFRCAR